MTPSAGQEVTKISQSHKVLCLNKLDGYHVWMLLTIDRKLWRCGDVAGKPGTSDEVNLKLRVMGSPNGLVNSGEIVMEMRGEASSVSGLVRFSNGYIVVEDPWKGLRIGTYMMNYLVSWAIQNYPDHRAFGINLISCQAYAGNKERRNRLYEQFGFQFNWSTPDFSEGALIENMSIGDLNVVDPVKWEKTIVEFEFPQGLRKILDDSHTELIRRESLERQVETLLDQRCLLREKAASRQRSNALAGLVIFGLGLLVGVAGMKFM